MNVSVTSSNSAQQWKISPEGNKMISPEMRKALCETLPLDVLKPDGTVDRSQHQWLVDAGICPASSLSLPVPRASGIKLPSR